MRVSAASFVRPLPSEDVSGDGCLVERWARGVVVATADGLGHGPPAAEASAAFLRLVREGRDGPLPTMLQTAHRALAKGRGAVAAVARFDETARTVEVAGLGNVAVFVASGLDGPKHCVIPAGVLGSAFRTIRPQVLDFAEGDVLVLHTDGVSGRFPFDRLQSMEPAALARSIVTAYGKSSDDAACAVAVGVSDAHPSTGTEDAASFTLGIRVAGDAEYAAVATRAFADRSGFGVKAQWQLGIAVAELATNVLKFGREGCLTLTFVAQPREHAVVEMVDRGTGIADLALAATDGFSEGALLTADRPRAPGQGLGVGLGSVRRMMDDVAIETGPTGTRVVARKYR
jgi:negative regulator of sigma-B (phosphoserine phosphatase)